MTDPTDQTDKMDQTEKDQSNMPPAANNDPNQNPTTVRMTDNSQPLAAGVNNPQRIEVVQPQNRSGFGFAPRPGARPERQRKQNAFPPEERNREHFAAAYRTLKSWLYSDEFTRANRTVRERRTVHFVKACLPFLCTSGMHDLVTDATLQIIYEHHGRDRLIEIVDRHLEMYWDFNETLIDSLTPFDVFQNDRRSYNDEQQQTRRSVATTDQTYASVTNSGYQTPTNPSPRVGQQQTLTSNIEYQTTPSVTVPIVQLNPSGQNTQASGYYYAETNPTVTTVATQNSAANYFVTQAATPAQNMTPVASVYSSTQQVANPVYYATPNLQGATNLYANAVTIVEQHHNFVLTSNRTLYIDHNVPQWTIDNIVSMLRNVKS